MFKAQEMEMQPTVRETSATALEEKQNNAQLEAQQSNAKITIKIIKKLGEGTTKFFK
jgi:hypothetical protein